MCPNNMSSYTKQFLLQVMFLWNPKTFQDWFTNHWLRLFNPIVFKKWCDVTFIMHRISLNVSNRMNALHILEPMRDQILEQQMGGNFPQNLCIHTNEDFPIGICPLFDGNQDEFL